MKKILASLMTMAFALGFVGYSVPSMAADTCTKAAASEKKADKKCDKDKKEKKDEKKCDKKEEKK